MPAIENNMAPIQPLTGGERRERALEELKKATEEFEAIFINSMLKAMRNTIIESNLFPEQAGKDVYRAMMDEYLAKEISRSGGVGISRMLFEELSKYMGEEVDRGTK